MHIITLRTAVQDTRIILTCNFIGPITQISNSPFLPVFIVQTIETDIIAVSLFSINYYERQDQPEITQSEIASAAEELKLALGLIRSATKNVQTVAFEESSRALDTTKSRSKDTMQTISRAQLEVYDGIKRNLAVLTRLPLAGGDRP